MHTQRRQPAYRPTRVFDGPIDSGRFRRGNGQGPTAGAEQTAGARRKASGGCFRPDSGFDSGDGRRERKRQRGRGRGKLILVAALALAALFVAQSLIRGRIETLTSPVAGKGEPASSTPVGGWRQGEVPYLYQTDPQWSEEPYAGGNMRENGCGPTCLSMAYVALTGNTNLDPTAMARLSEEQGHTVDGMTAWILMSDGAASIGLNSREISASADAVRAELEAGHPVICSVRPGDFTTTGHFIVLAGLAENGQVAVRDPNSAQNSTHPWDLERILAQCANLWAFSL